MKHTPRHNWVTCRRLRSPERKTKGGIALPDEQKISNLYGRVVAKGPGSPKGDGSILEIDLEVGQIVMVSIYPGINMTWDERDPDLFFVQDEDVMSVVEDFPISGLALPDKTLAIVT